MKNGWLAGLIDDNWRLLGKGESVRLLVVMSWFTLRSENIQAYKETPRISFYFLVTNPGNPTTFIPKADVEAAIRYDPMACRKQSLCGQIINLTLPGTLLRIHAAYAEDSSTQSSFTITLTSPCLSSALFSFPLLLAPLLPPCIQVVSWSHQRCFPAGWQHAGVWGSPSNTGPASGAASHSVAGGVWGGHGTCSYDGHLPHCLWLPWQKEDVSVCLSDLRFTVYWGVVWGLH